MNLPDGWAVKPLAEVVEIQRGFDLPRHARRPGPYPVLTSGETGGFHDEGPVKGPGMTIGRATNLGKPKWSESDFWPHNTTMFVKDFKGNVRRWVYHLFENTNLAGFDSGSVQPMLNRNYIAQVPVVVPPLGAQEAIAEVLGAVDDKIAANATLVRTADELAAALTRASLSAELAPLGDSADIVMGSSPPGSSYNESGQGTVFYQGVRDFGVRTPTNRVWTTAPVRMAAISDTLVSVRAPVGRTNLASEDTCIGRGLAGIRDRYGRAMTLFHVLRDQPEIWAPFESEGTVFGSINKQQLAGVRIGVVHPDRVDSLEAELVSVESQIESALRESAQLAKVRDALLPGLMSGRIRVKDAERVVEEAV